MTDCLFCKMVSGEISPDKIMETDNILAFRDINPQAPTHILIIPKKHISTINDITEEDTQVMGKLYQAAKEIAAQEGLAEPGYRTVMNCNSDGGQAVYHIHLHLLGGRAMGWPPG